MKIVLDANLLVALGLELPYSTSTHEALASWLKDQAEFLVPSLCFYEVTSALRKAVVLKTIRESEAETILAELLALHIQQIPPTPDLLKSALAWAKRIGQTVAYDSVYLALAEREDAPFWTADARLAKVCRQKGLTWVRQIA